jgi:hypothetical protein
MSVTGRLVGDYQFGSNVGTVMSELLQDTPTISALQYQLFLFYIYLMHQLQYTLKTPCKETSTFKMLSSLVLGMELSSTYCAKFVPLIFLPFT